MLWRVAAVAAAGVGLSVVVLFSSAALVESSSAALVASCESCGRCVRSGDWGNRVAAPAHRVELATFPLQSEVDLCLIRGRWRWRLPRDSIGAGAGASCIANGAGANCDGGTSVNATGATGSCWELRGSCIAGGTSDGGANVTGTSAATSVATSRHRYRKP